MSEPSIITKDLGIVIESIENKKVVEFDYQGGKDSVPVKRTVHGWAIATRNGTDYLIGFQEAADNKGGIRQYKTCDIQNPVISEKDMTEFPNVAANPEKWDSILVEATVVEKPKAES